MRTQSTYIFGLLILVSATICGCGEDSGEPEQGPEVTPVGTIRINPEPNSVNAPWQITRPGDFSQSRSGDATLTDMTAGDYTVTWGAVTGWTTPSPAVATRPLAANRTLSFTGTYVAQRGTITINQEPNSIYAPWQITGPGGFARSAAGDAILAAMIAGSYTVTWGTVAGWTLPNPAAITQTLAMDETLSFTGTYVVQAGTITINPQPNRINAPWQITGPGDFSQSATGDATLADMTAGNYTLTWGAVTDWTLPSPAAVTQSLAADGTLLFTGVYIEDAVFLVGFVSISAGTFTMGSPTDEPGRYNNEPQHQVTLTHGFDIQAREVTNQQYMELAQWAYDQGHVTADGSYLYDNLDGSTEVLKELGAESPEISFSNGVFSCINPDQPVKSVTWYGSVAYCDWLSLQRGLPRAYNHVTWQCNGGNPYTAVGYRLPTEAEWEYACRAGTQTPFTTGSCLDAGTEANYNGNSPQSGCPTGPYVGWTVPVGAYPENGYGLLDMHGNLYEWGNDWYGTYGGTVTDPAGPGTGDNRVIRGGAWNSNAQVCRSASRYYYSPNGVSAYFGFRPVKSSE
jgi:formylglycine-generating enzyme required for sulfatase activity